MDSLNTVAVLQPNTLKRIQIIASYELTRLFNTKRGWMALTAFALVWYFILSYPIYYASSVVAQPDFADSLRNVFGLFGVQRILEWQVPELSVYWAVSLILYPLFALFITADQISSDRARGTLRFLLLRSTRFELLLGRYLGQLVILTILVFATLCAASVMAVYRDSTAISAIPADFGFVLFHLFFVLAPVVAVTALTSVVCQSARSASFLAIIGISLSFIFVAVISYYVPQLGVLSDYLLGAQVKALAASSGVNSLTHLFLPLGQSVVILVGAMLLFKRRAI